MPPGTPTLPCHAASRFEGIICEAATWLNVDTPTHNNTKIKPHLSGTTKDSFCITGSGYANLMPVNNTYDCASLFHYGSVCLHDNLVTLNTRASVFLQPPVTQTGNNCSWTESSQPVPIWGFSIAWLENDQSWIDLYQLVSAWGSSTTRPECANEIAVVPSASGYSTIDRSNRTQTTASPHNTDSVTL